ncbi:MAG: TrmH family RNA methyltransferase [Candidatus Latescibacteria bacterium]|nr:TrmH family RNA methyltransferase [Candidatus Latescibacterota bacterium]
MKGLRPGNLGKETSFEVRTCDSPLPLGQYEQLPKHPVHLVLDNLRSAFNVGSIYRTADTARLASVCTGGYTAHPPHPKLDKTALGTLEYVPTRHFATTLEAVDHLRDQGMAVWALETTSASRPYTAVDFPRPVGLVLGNEALGVDRQVLERCDQLVEIPMFGFKNSLNVAAACAVVVFEILRQWEATAAVPSGRS